MNARKLLSTLLIVVAIATLVFSSVVLADDEVADELIATLSGDVENKEVVSGEEVVSGDEATYVEAEDAEDEATSGEEKVEPVSGDEATSGEEKVEPVSGDEATSGEEKVEPVSGDEATSGEEKVEPVSGDEATSGEEKVEPVSGDEATSGEEMVEPVSGDEATSGEEKAEPVSGDEATSGEEKAEPVSGDEVTSGDKEVEFVMPSDVSEDSWYAEYVEEALKGGYVDCYEDNKFMPKENATLGDALYGVMTVGSKNYSGDGYLDVIITSGDEYPLLDEALKEDEDYVSVRISGDESEDIDSLLERGATREEVARLAYSVAKINGKGFTGTWAFLLDFEDADEISDEAFEAIAWCNMHNIIVGRSNNRVCANEVATRAELATILVRLSEVL